MVRCSSYNKYVRSLTIRVAEKLRPLDFVVFSTDGACGCSMPPHNFRRVRLE
jgi:hypothetical protein